MHESLENITNSLDDLALRIEKSYKSNSTMTELWGWNFPPVNKDDLAYISKELSNRIKLANADTLNADFLIETQKIPHKIEVFKTKTLPYLFNGHGKEAVPVYFTLISNIEYMLKPLFDNGKKQENHIFNWEEIVDKSMLPAGLKRKLTGIQNQLNNIIPEIEQLEGQIELINSATEAAETLPTDLQTLKEAKDKTAEHLANASVSAAKAAEETKKIEEKVKKLKEEENEIHRLIALSEDAYKITTTKGLAAAFEQRANKLTQSTWYWVIGLILALGSGIYFGKGRFEELNNAIQGNKDSNIIWVQLVISVLSLGAPIWFAWIATKQISQRFKLAEDYAFKASVAKAYEGYRKEAARIDEKLEGRLFGSALTRLEEAPLRLVEKENYGSPWHEALSSSRLQELITLFPELANKLTIPKSIIRKPKSIPKVDS